MNPQEFQRITGNVVLETDQDSRGGYLSVREGNFRLPLMTEPDFVRETLAAGSTPSGRVTYPSDPQAFLEHIGRENASLAGTGYRWLEESTEHRRYKLAFRPELQRGAVPWEDPRQILGRDLTNVENAVSRRWSMGRAPSR